MTSQLSYLIARERQAALAHQAERVRQARDSRVVEPDRTRRRPIGSLLAALRLGRAGRERQPVTAAALSQSAPASLSECRCAPH